MIFEYRKSNNRYWNKPKWHYQVMTKALPIVETLYLRYSLLSLFELITSHFMYSQNTLRIANINKAMGGEQLILRDSWYEKNNIWVIYPIIFQNAQLF